MNTEMHVVKIESDSASIKCAKRRIPSSARSDLLVNHNRRAVTLPESQLGRCFWSLSQSRASTLIRAFHQARMRRRLTSLNFITSGSPSGQITFGKITLPSQLNIPFKQSPFRVSLCTVSCLRTKAKNKRCGTADCNDRRAPLHQPRRRDVGKCQRATEDRDHFDNALPELKDTLPLLIVNPVRQRAQLYRTATVP